VYNLQKEFTSEFNAKKPEKGFDIKSTYDYLNNLKSHLIKRTNILIYEKDAITEILKSKGLSNNDLIKLKEDYFNRSVAEMVLNTNEMVKISDYKGQFIRKDSPVYQYPLSSIGRAQFYSGIKRIGSHEIETMWFNILIIWSMTLVLYILLLTDSLKRLLGLLFRHDKRKR
jgi:hypothetical protein